MLFFCPHRQITPRRSCTDSAYCWIQCGDRHSLKFEVPGVGLGWSNRTATILALLLPRYKCRDIRGRLSWQGKAWVFKARIRHYAAGGRTQGSSCAGPSEQARLAWCHGRLRNMQWARTASDQKQTMESVQNLSYARHRPRYSLRVARQHAQGIVNFRNAYI